MFQKFADLVIKQMESAPNKKMFVLWFNIGMDFNDWCVAQEIYLN